MPFSSKHDGLVIYQREVVGAQLGVVFKKHESLIAGWYPTPKVASLIAHQIAHYLRRRDQS